MTPETVTHYSRRSGAISADLGEELAVLDMASGAYVGFNATAAFIWRLLESPRTLDQLVAETLKEFAVAEPRCRETVTGLLRELRFKQLVQESNG